MNCFQLIKQVLDEEYGLIDGAEDDKDRGIEERLKQLGADYQDLTVYKEIDYSDPVTRFAYIFRYVTSHANLVTSMIGKCKPLQKLLGNGRPMIACVGGGPGSDMLGILKYMDGSSDASQVTFTVLDSETAWGDSWIGVFGKVETELRILPNFQVLDVFDEERWGRGRKYAQADLVTMVYFVSEVYGREADARPYFDHLFTSMRPGSLVLFIDNQHSEFYQWFDRVAVDAGLEVLCSGLSTETLPPAEEKTDLGVYYEKFKDPKIRTSVSWRVLRKP